MAWLGLALCAQAAHATYGKVTIVKINKGGTRTTRSDSIPSCSRPPATSRSRAGSSRPSRSSATSRNGCTTPSPTLTVSEKQPTPGYTLKAISCVHKQGQGDFPGEPAPRAPRSRRRHDSHRRNHQPQGEPLRVGQVLRHQRPTPPTSRRSTSSRTGPATAHSGDTLTFGYTVTNPGTVPLTNVTATDDKCSPLTRTGNTRRHDARSGRRLDLHVLVRDPVEPGRRQPGREHGHDLRHAARRRRRPAVPPRCATPISTRRRSCPRARTTPPETPAQTAGTSPAKPAAADRGEPRSGAAGQRKAAAVPVAARPPVRWRPAVAGRRIVKVTFYVDGKKVKTLTNANRKGPVGAADEREALRLRDPSRAGDRPVRQVQPDEGQDAAVELQPLPSGERHAQVHGLTPRPRSRPGSPGRGRGTPFRTRGDLSPAGTGWTNGRPLKGVLRPPIGYIDRRPGMDVPV